MPSLGQCDCLFILLLAPSVWLLQNPPHSPFQYPAGVPWGSLLSLLLISLPTFPLDNTIQTHKFKYHLRVDGL